MKTLFTSLLLLGVLCAFSQPSLTTGTFNLQPGNNSSVYLIAEPYPSVGNPGANQTWDFSAAVIDTSVNYSVYDPANSTLSATYPDATVLYRLAGGGQIIEAFYEMLPDSIVYHGYQTTIVAQGVALTQQATFTNTEKIMDLPMSFQQVHTDSFSGPFTSFNTTTGTMNYFRSGNITTEYDGYGTVITPFTTYQNVIRIHASEIYSDTLSSIPGFSFGFESDIYYWFRPGDKFPIAQHTTLKQGGLLTSTTVAVYNPWATSLDDASSNISTSVFPNPANEFLRVTFELAQPQPASIQLYNAAGQVVQKTMLGPSPSGQYSSEIEVAGLPAGVYLLEVLSDSQRAVKKIQIH